MTDDANNLSYDEAAKRLGLTVNELRDLRADRRACVRHRRWRALSMSSSM